MYYEQLKEATFDPRTGEPLNYKRKGQREAHYIPFDKKTVDKIIKESAHSNAETTKFVVKFAAEDSDGIHGRQATEMSSATTNLQIGNSKISTN